VHVLLRHGARRGRSLLQMHPSSFARESPLEATSNSGNMATGMYGVVGRGRPWSLKRLNSAEGPVAIRNQTSTRANKHPVQVGRNRTAISMPRIGKSYIGKIRIQTWSLVSSFIQAFQMFVGKTKNETHGTMSEARETFRAAHKPNE
jgi:hypothetical protein